MRAATAASSCERAYFRARRPVEVSVSLARPAPPHAAARAHRARRARRPGPPDPVPPVASGPRHAPVHALQVPHHARSLRRATARRSRTPNGPRGRPRAAAHRGSTSCPSSSTWCAATCRSSARGRCWRATSRTGSPSGSRSAPASPAGPRCNGGHRLSVDEKIALDTWYVRNAGPWIDLRIVCRTLRMMVLGKELEPARAGTGAAPTRPSASGSWS